MALTLRILSDQARTMGPAAVKVFDDRGGTIGRSASSDWVLPDPDRFVSSGHARITCEGGAWFLADISTNGTFINGAAQPVGPGAPVQLNQGDRLMIGDYEVEVSLEGDGAMTGPPATPTGPFGPSATDPFASPATDPFASPATDPLDAFGSTAPPMPPAATDPFARPAAPAEPDLAPPQTLDPLEALETPQHTSPNSDWSPPPMADNAGMSEHFQPPRAQPAPAPAPAGAQVIPDDWDKTSYDSAASPAAPQPAAPPSEGLLPEDWDKTTYESPLQPAQPPSPPPAPPPASPSHTVPPASPSHTVPPAGPAPAPAGPATAPPAPPPGMATVPPAMPGPHPGTGAHTIPPAVPGMAPVSGAVPTETLETPHFTPGPADTRAVHALLQGAGVQVGQLPPESVEPLMRLAGAIFREVVAGMMEVLQARASLKSEFRVAQTTIRPMDNNPLKFSPTPESALEYLLLRRGHGYLEPLDAIREGFSDIKAHQMALLAGMRAAFESLLQSFDPQNLEQQFDRGKRGALRLPGKARFWEAYVEMMEELQRDPDQAFRRLFGEEFAKAYEEQMQRLSHRR